jgi:hypothetical protein
VGGAFIEPLVGRVASAHGRAGIRTLDHGEASVKVRCLKHGCLLVKGE